LFIHAPGHVPLIAHNWAVWARLLGRSGQAMAQLDAWRQQHAPSLDVTQAMATLADEPSAARRFYIDHLKTETSLVAAQLWLAGRDLGGTADEEQLIKKSLDRACAPLKRYRCAACGFEAQQYFWHCPGCQSWDSYPPKRVEEL